MRGVRATLDQAGVALIGGHTAEGLELALGLTVNGFAEPDGMLRKGGLKAGDALILTKPLGTGVILAADMRQQAPGDFVDRAIEVMLQSNGQAAAIVTAHGAHAATDVTGFGLIGHLGEMAGGVGPSCLDHGRRGAGARRRSRAIRPGGRQLTPARQRTVRARAHRRCGKRPGPRRPV